MRHLANRGPFAAPSPAAKVNQNQAPTPTSASINEQKQRPSTSAAAQSSSARQPKRTIQPRSTQRPQSNGGRRQLPQGQTSPARTTNGRISQPPSSHASTTRGRSADQITPTQRQVGNQRTSLRPGVQTKPSQNSNRQRIGTRQSNSASRLNRQTPNTSPKTGRRRTSNQQSNSVSSSRGGQRREVNSPASRVVTSSRQTSRRGNTNIQPNGLAASNNRQSNQKGQNLQMNKPRTLNRKDPLLQSDALRRTEEVKPQSTFQSIQQRQSRGNSIRQNNQKPRQPNIPSKQTHMRSKPVPQHHKEPNQRKQGPNVHSRQNPSNQRQPSAHPLTHSRVKPRTQKPTNRNPGNQGGQNKDPSQVFVNKRVRSNAPLETVLIRNHRPKNGKKVDISIALDGQSGLSLTMKDPSQPTNFIRGAAT
ncbi:putative uncharacterized protein DDB_G0290521 [Haliotis rubra]|uniref:putative uncharacterized protein DDB_G0290521 n=1 Tax=Haliotis rubra TaxID=36100 RepID=UPI001EE584D6|nr:putative uncharacterized protein DDB_G0290521 [Haliotis rubra]